MTKKASPKKTAVKKAPTKKAAKSTNKTTAKAKPEELDLKIVSTSKCPTVSGKSTLTYNISIDDEAHFYIRIFGNSGAGFFSREWIPMDAVKELLGNIPDEHEITSLHLTPLFKSGSANKIQERGRP